MMAWIKKLLLKEGIKELNLAKPYIAQKLTDAQKTLGSIPPEQFANEVITEIQVRICKHVGIDPADIGIKEN